MNDLTLAVQTENPPLSEYEGITSNLETYL